MSSHIADDDDEFLYGSSEPATNAPTQATTGQDSESFDLYGVGGEGGSSSTEVKITSGTTSATQSAEDKKNNVTGATNAKEGASGSGQGDGDDEEAEEEEEEEEDESEEEEDSESDIEIVMDNEENRQESAGPSKQTVVNIKTNTPAKSGTTTVTNANGTVDVIPATKPGGVDINAVGSIDGVELYDVDLDGVEDKPWRKPGADLTDYFNYGFNENIWRAYCHKQKMMRENPFAGFDMDPKLLMDLPPELGLGMPMPGMQGLPGMMSMPGMPGMPGMMGRGMPMPGMGMPMGNMMNAMNQRGGPGGAGRGGRFIGPGGPGGPNGPPGGPANAGRGRGNANEAGSGADHEGGGGRNDRSPSFQRNSSVPAGGDDSHGDGPSGASFQNEFQQGGVPFFGGDGFNQGNFRGNGRGAGTPNMRGGMIGGGGIGRGRGGPTMVQGPDGFRPQAGRGGPGGPNMNQWDGANNFGGGPGFQGGRAPFNQGMGFQQGPPFGGQMMPSMGHQQGKQNDRDDHDDRRSQSPRPSSLDRDQRDSREGSSRGDHRDRDRSRDRNRDRDRSDHRDSNSRVSSREGSGGGGSRERSSRSDRDKERSDRDRSDRDYHRSDRDRSERFDRSDRDDRRGGNGSSSSKEKSQAEKDKVHATGGYR
ncbi:pre-mRNA 3-end-processing factor fip1l1 [Gamsiella multidivaricata]|nr:pre-mRNA 3-end-processing factor fip1l1 [Gamsiella multidivaricata]